MLDQTTANRLQSVRGQFDEWKVDAVLITGPSNRRWLSGFTGSAGQLLITRDQAILSTDFRYWEQAQQEAPAFALFQNRRKAEDSKAFLALGGVAHIGIEAANMSVADYAALRRIDGYQWKPLLKTVEMWRQVKSAAELTTIRAAAALSDQGMSQVNLLAQPGMTEQVLAWKLEQAVREAGASTVAYPIIVASGPNSALPHHRPGNRELQLGDAILIDLGAEVDGYKSDLTRTFYLGDEPDDKFWEIYNSVLQAQTTALQNMKAGMTCKDIDSLARDSITAAGYAEYFGHGLGHGVGLDIHEKPSLSQLSEKEIMPEGAITTVEPGIYVPGWGGVRIEDLVLVSSSGASLLSHCAKIPTIPAH